MTIQVHIFFQTVLKNNIKHNCRILAKILENSVNFTSKSWHLVLYWHYERNRLDCTFLCSMASNDMPHTVQSPADRGSNKIPYNPVKCYKILPVINCHAYIKEWWQVHIWMDWYSNGGRHSPTIEHEDPIEISLHICYITDSPLKQNIDNAG